jgi:hypothetical protein
MFRGRGSGDRMMAFADHLALIWHQLCELAKELALTAVIVVLVVGLMAG